MKFRDPFYLYSSMSPALDLAGRSEPQDQSSHTRQNGPNGHSTFDSSSSSECNFKNEEEQHDQEVVNLARRFTTRSTQSHYQSPFTAEEGSRLDPKAPNFRAKEWAKAFYNIRYNVGDNTIPARVAGVAFKNLNVWGHGSPTDFQMSVGNSVLKLPSLFGRGSQKIDILRSLDGLLLPGEQLCVLGPPGQVTPSLTCICF